MKYNLNKECDSILLIEVKKQAIDLTACDLGQQCFEPLIRHYKIGMSNEMDMAHFKEQFYEQLAQGQRALFVFYTYFNHANKSLLEFYWWSAYYYAQPKSWLALKASANYFENEPLRAIFEKLEQLFQQHHYPNALANFTITREDLAKNSALQATIFSLHTQFEQTTPLTIKLINDHIEKNIHDFVHLID